MLTLRWRLIARSEGARTGQQRATVDQRGDEAGQLLVEKGVLRHAATLTVPVNIVTGCNCYGQEQSAIRIGLALGERP
jgi:hypothetical protein